MNLIEFALTEVIVLLAAAKLPTHFTVNEFCNCPLIYFPRDFERISHFRFRIESSEFQRRYASIEIMQMLFTIVCANTPV